MSETMSETWRAVYRDQHGRTYSCPVVKKDGAWAMITSDGHQPITHEFQDDIGGLLTFVEYRAEPDSRLHVELGGSFRTLQEAAMRVTAEYETNRQRARREMLVELNQSNPRRDQETRRIANEHAQQIRPRGKGSFIVKTSGE